MSTVETLILRRATEVRLYRLVVPRECLGLLGEPEFAAQTSLERRVGISENALFTYGLLDDLALEF